MRLAASHRLSIGIAALLTLAAIVTLFAISQRFESALERQRIAEDIGKNVAAMRSALLDHLVGRRAAGAAHWQKAAQQLRTRIETLATLEERGPEVKQFSRDLGLAMVIFARLAEGAGEAALPSANIEELRAQRAGVLHATIESLTATAETMDRRERRTVLQLGMVLGALALGFALLLLASYVVQSWIMQRRVLRPLVELGRTMASVAAGRSGTGFTYPRADEVGDLTRGFNSMLSQLGEARDDLVRKTAESTRLAQRARMHQLLRYQALLIEASREAIIVREFSGRVLQWNRGAQELYGYPAAQALGRTLAQLLDSQQSAVATAGSPEPAATALQALGRWDGELRQRCADGSERDVICEQVLLDITSLPKEEEEEEQKSRPGLVLEIHHDITERKKNEEFTRASLAEKELLLREIHHRVKNNLQIVCSLLQLRGRRITDAELRAVFAETEARVRAMALVHESLYREVSLASIDFGHYLKNLAAQLLATLHAGGAEVSLETECASIHIPVDTAIPLGLIATELVTNALKHAYRDRTTGRLRIALAAAGPGRILFQVSDDGPGMPAGGPSTEGSLGLTLIRMLVSQVRGEIVLRPGPGVDWHITLPLQDHPG